MQKDEVDASLGSILVVITHEAFALGQLALFNSLSNQLNTRVFLLSTIGNRLSRICRDRGIPLPQAVITPPNTSGFDHSKIARSRQSNSTLPVNLPHASRWLVHLLILLKKVFKRLASLPYNVMMLALTYRRQIRYIDYLIKKSNVKWILLTEASPAYGAPVFRTAANRNNVYIATSVQSFTAPQSYAEIYFTSKSRDAEAWQNWLIRTVFKKWCIEHRGKLLQRSPLAEILAQEFTNVSPPNPWTTVGSLEDLVLAESTIVRDFYLRTGVDEGKIVVTGSGRLDELQQINSKSFYIREEICTELNLRGPLLLCALPQAHWIEGRPEAEFHDHQTMIDAWIEGLLSQNTFNIICSLHPSMKSDDFQKYETNRLKISQRSSTELLSICDVFVTCGSTITPLAIALGKPVINYDVYRYSLRSESGPFAGSYGTLTVLNKKDFESALNKIAEDAEYLETLRLNQIKCAHNWGHLDGKSGTKILAELQKFDSSRNEEPINRSLDKHCKLIKTSSEVMQQS